MVIAKSNAAGWSCVEKMELDDECKGEADFSVFIIIFF